MSDEYDYWRAAIEGRFGSIVETSPECGFWRVRNGRTWEPVAFWHHTDESGPTLLARVGREGSIDDPYDLGKLWIACAKHPITQEAYDHWIETGHWLTDPPADITPAAPKPDETAPPQPVSNTDELPGPGHNSGDPDSFATMRAELEGDIAEARAYFARNPVKSKTDADKCENWRRRIYDAAKALDERRKAEKKPWQDKADAVDAQYVPVIRSAQEFSGRNGPLDKMGQGFIAAEQARLRKEAEERARAEHAARVAAAEAERKRLEEERAAKLRDDPVAALTEPEPALPDPADIPPPVVEAPKVMIGTGPTRRGAQSAQHTATITDAAKLAAHLVAQRHPDLMECLQKIANAAARSRARTTLPGVTMSWETGRAA